MLILIFVKNRFKSIDNEILKLPSILFTYLMFVFQEEPLHDSASLGMRQNHWRFDKYNLELDSQVLDSFASNGLFHFEFVKSNLNSLSSTLIDRFST